MQQNNNETWGTIPGYEWLYEASTFGRIRSKDRYVAHRHNKSTQRIKGKIKSQRKDSNGNYLIIDLSKNGKGKTRLVHRLVLKTFSPIDEKLEVNHKNGIKTDNSINNLEWVTSSENKIHAINTGLARRYKKRVLQINNEGQIINKHK